MISLLSTFSLTQSLPIPPYPFSHKLHTHSHSLVSIPKSSNQNQTPHLTTTQEDGIPIEHVKTLVKFKSRYNYIRVLEVSRRADHPFRGSRLLLLDSPGNIHSINFIFKTLTNTYFDVFATLPPILPPGPIGILGFGAGSAAKLLLELYSDVVVHGWELDPAVIDVGREYFGLSRLEKDYKDRVFVYIGNGFRASVRDGFAGVLVDLFSKGCLVSELQDKGTWEMLRSKLRKGGRIMVNVGGSCVEAEDSRRDGKVVMEESLKAMYEVFGDDLYVLSLGNRKDDSSLALTGGLPDLKSWKMALPKALRGYVDLWTPSAEWSQNKADMRRMTLNGIGRSKGTLAQDGLQDTWQHSHYDEGSHIRKMLAIPDEAAESSLRGVPWNPPAPIPNVFLHQFLLSPPN